MARKRARTRKRIGKGKKSGAKWSTMMHPAFGMKGPRKRY